MSTAKIIGLVIGVVVVGGLVYVGTRSSDENVRGPLDATQEEQQVVESSETRGTIGNLLSRGGDWECAWSFTQDGAQSDGVIRFSGKKFATDMTNVQNGMTITAHSISDGEMIYAWTDLAPFGTKMDLSVIEGIAAPTADPQAQMFSTDYDFDCDPWSPEASAFVPPSDVQFMAAPQVQ